MVLLKIQYDLRRVQEYVATDYSGRATSNIKIPLKKHHTNTSELKTNPLNIQSVDGATLPKTLYE